MSRARGLDITVTATTDRRAALDGCDAVLSSFRPGGFQARVHDERIPLEHGVIGQETQGAGGFFMALRAITVLKDVCAEMEQVCPDAWIFNYTNPVNIVAEAVTHNSPVKIVSLCEGPIYFRDTIAESAGLDPDEAGRDDGGAQPRLLGCRAELRRAGPDAAAGRGLGAAPRRPDARAGPPPAAPARGGDGGDPGRLLPVLLLHGRGARRVPGEADVTGGGHPRLVDRLLAPLRGAGRTDDPQLDPGRSRGGINELELAIDVMDSIFNDKGEVHPVNMPNAGGALPGFPDDLVVEVLGRCHAGGIDVLPSKPLPRHVRGLVEMLGEYQALAAATAWNGTRRDGIRALSANPLVRQIELAEQLYDALATAHRDYLPERLQAA